MNSDTSIFYRVVNNENIMTEPLCKFMQFKAFRDEFLNSFLEEKEIIQ